MSYTVFSILDRVRARLNDTNKDLYTDAVLLPFVQDAADEMQLELELKGTLVLEKVSANITVIGGWTDLKSHNLLPFDLLEPQRLEERLSGSSDTFAMMTRREWTPDVQQTDSLCYWSFRGQNIFFVGATSDREVRIYYLKRLITVQDVESVVEVNNSQLFMICQTGSLAARFIGENPTRADELHGEAEIALNKLTRIGTKNKQGTRTRRRPFVLVGRRNWA